MLYSWSGVEWSPDHHCVTEIAVFHRSINILSDTPNCNTQGGKKKAAYYLTWSKSSFGLFHKLIQKTQMNFLANPIIKIV